MIKVKNTLKGKLNVSVVKEYPELENITITPTLEEQKLKSEKYGFGDVTVEGIPATDIEITPTQQKQVKTGIFKEVTVNAIEGQELNLNPSEEQQNFEGVFLGVNINPIQVQEITTDLDFSSSDSMELTAQEGVYIKKATINKDANLSPENIKSGVTIAGVSGDVADTSDADATSDDIAFGKTAYVNNQKVVGVAEINNNNALFGTSLSNGSASYPGISKNLKTLVGNFTSGSNASFMFANLINLESIKGTLDTSNVSNMSQIFSQCSNLVEIPELDIGKATEAEYAFRGCSKLKKISLKNASNLAYAKEMFLNCTSLESVILSGTSKLVRTTNMFSNCTALKTVSDMNLSSVTGTNMAGMFTKCTSLETAPNLILNTASAVSIAGIFDSCTNLKNVPLFDTSQVTTMLYMFSGCKNLTYESINNILAMCANATNYTATKTLYSLGILSSSYDAATIQSLSNYQAFLDAGWTIGF